MRYNDHLFNILYMYIMSFRKAIGEVQIVDIRTHLINKASSSCTSFFADH